MQEDQLASDGGKRQVGTKSHEEKNGRSPWSSDESVLPAFTRFRTSKVAQEVERMIDELYGDAIFSEVSYTALCRNDILKSLDAFLTMMS